jgi:hypothetical protein
MTPTNQSLYLVSGMSASGKSSFCRWLESQHGFRHIDFDFAPEKIDELNEAIMAGRPEDFFERYSADKPLVIDWAIPQQCLPVVEMMKAKGISVWWFDAPHDEARAAFIAREAEREDGWSTEVFDRQWRTITAVRPAVEAVFWPNVVQTLQPGGERMAFEEIARVMGIGG